MESQSNLNVFLLMWIWKIKNRGRFRATYWFSIQCFKNEIRLALYFRCNLISMLFFQSYFVPPWNILCDYTSRYLFWFNLSVITVVFSWYFIKVSRRRSKEASFFSQLQVSENIHDGFSSSVTLKVDFCNNVLLQVFSLVETCFIEIWVLLTVTLQKKLPQISFLGVSRTNTLQRCTQTQSNI